MYTTKVILTEFLGAEVTDPSRSAGRLGKRSAATMRPLLRAPNRPGLSPAVQRDGGTFIIIISTAVMKEVMKDLSAGCSRRY